jgi:cytochrome c peroxidase
MQEVLKSVALSKEELGKLLFFEKALSLDSSVSCSSCHIPAYAFSDTSALSSGVDGKLSLRNAPGIMNLHANEAMFYDGRAKNISDQVHFPIQDPNEMNLAMLEAVKRLNKDLKYKNIFNSIFHSDANEVNIAEAISAFEMTLQTSNTPFDAFMSGDESAINESAKRGRELFLSEKAKCFDCHFGPDFTGDEFKNIGLYDGADWKDLGRFNISKDSTDIGKFKVPGLRNVGVTGPYMHNGKFKTLEEVIEYYTNPYALVKNPINLDTSLLKPIDFTEQEKADLLSFLKSLTDKQFLNR